MEIQWVLESRKYIVDSDNSTWITYMGTCNRDTFVQIYNSWENPYEAKIWALYQIVETWNISEKKNPYDPITKKLLKQWSLQRTERTTYSYV